MGNNLGVLISFWSFECFIKILATIGTVVVVDDETSAWSNLEYARVLVRLPLHADAGMKKKIRINGVICPVRVVEEVGCRYEMKSGCLHPKEGSNLNIRSKDSSCEGLDGVCLSDSESSDELGNECVFVNNEKLFLPSPEKKVVGSVVQTQSSHKHDDVTRLEEGYVASVGTFVPDTRVEPFPTDTLARDQLMWAFEQAQLNVKDHNDNKGSKLAQERNVPFLFTASALMGHLSAVGTTQYSHQDTCWGLRIF